MERENDRGLSGDRGDRSDKPTRRKKRVISRRKRTLDPAIVIDYKLPDILKRFVTDRGKIIPRRVSGANASQQRAICTAVKRARYLGLIPSAISHRSEKGFSGDMAAATVFAAPRDPRRFDRPQQSQQQGDINLNQVTSRPDASEE